MALFEPVLAALQSADVRFVVGGVAVVLHDHPLRRVASIDHLIAMKTASGRPQDLADVAALEALRG